MPMRCLPYAIIAEISIAKPFSRVYMGVFDTAWSSLKKQGGIENDPPLDDEDNSHGLPNFEDSDDPVNDAHEHFYAADNDFDVRREALAQEVSGHLRDVYNSYKDGHPEWDNPQPGKDGPPGTDELSALIEEMAAEHGAQLPW